MRIKILKITSPTLASVIATAALLLACGQSSEVREPNQVATQTAVAESYFADAAALAQIRPRVYQGMPRPSPSVERTPRPTRTPSPTRTPTPVPSKRSLEKHSEELQPLLIGGASFVRDIDRLEAEWWNAGSDVTQYARAICNEEEKKIYLWCHAHEAAAYERDKAKQKLEDYRAKYSERAKNWVRSVNILCKWTLENDRWVAKRGEDREAIDALWDACRSRRYKARTDETQNFRPFVPRIVQFFGLQDVERKW